MIVIDIDMPNDCRECPMRQKGINTPNHYCMALLGKKLSNDIFNSKADFCPIKCDIEDIKAEITDEMNFCAKTSKYTRSGFDTALNIIDKHTSEDMRDGTDENS